MSWSWSSMQRHRREPLPNRRWSGASRRSPSNAGSRSGEPAGLPPALSQPTGHALERDVAARPKSPPLSPLRPGSATRARRCRSTAARGCSSGRLRCRSVRRPTTCPMPEGRDATALRLTPPPYVGVGTCPHIGLSTARSSSCQDHNPRTTTTVVAVANRPGRAAWRRRDVAQEAGKTLPGAGVRARHLTPPFSGPEQDQRLGVHRVAAVSTAHALVSGVAADAAEDDARRTGIWDGLPTGDVPEESQCFGARGAARIAHGPGATAGRSGDPEEFTGLGR